MAARPDAPFHLEGSDEGTGVPVLLIHGVGGNRTVWRDVIPRLKGDVRVLAPDLRGHGLSRAPAGSTFALDEMLGDLLELLRAKSLPDAHWVGFSGGALLALRAGLDHPDRVRSLTLVSGSAYTDAHTRSMTDRLAEVYAKEGADAYALRLLKDLFYPDWIEAHLEYADAVRAGVERIDLGPVAAWTRAIDRFDERNRIGSIQRPTLVVQGMDDALIDPSHGRILRQTIPGSQIRILPQTGHMIPVERPEETAEAIRAFVLPLERSVSS